MLSKRILTNIGLALALATCISIGYMNTVVSFSSSSSTTSSRSLEEVPLTQLAVIRPQRSSSTDGLGDEGDDDTAKNVEPVVIGDEDVKATTERVQNERQQTLRAACRERGSRRRLAHETIRPLFYRTFNVPSLDLTYCAVAKCATTTFGGFLTEITGNPCYSRTSRANCALGNHTHPHSFEDFRRNSLLIVRNPWTRIVSTYWDKFVVERHPLAAACYARHRKPLRGWAAVTFAEYVGCVLDDHRRKLPLDVHSAPMHWHCSPCRANYTYIAHLETIKADFRYLSRFVFPNSTSPEEYDRAIVATKRRINEAANVTAASYYDCYRSLSKATLARLVKLYRADAVYYGYPLRPL